MTCTSIASGKKGRKPESVSPGLMGHYGIVTGMVATAFRRARWRMTISFSRHQFPPLIIRHAVWLYVRFTLSYRDVEDLLAGHCHI
jgi:hypothetical protein